MNLSDLSRHQFVQESTLHGISHLRNSKSKVRTVFWLIVSFLSAGYATFEILREVKRISSGIEFETTYRLARIEEIDIPQFSYCFSNPLDVFDWGIVSFLTANLNWSTEDVGHLLASYSGFRDLKFKSMNISKQHIRKFGNITNQFFMLMHINICLNENQTGLIKTFQHFMQICITINCPLADDESGERPFSSVAIPNNMHDKPASNLRMKIIEFIRKVHDLNLTTDYQIYLLSLMPYPQLTSLNLFNFFYVDPILINRPTMKIVNCYKQICNSQEQKLLCLNKSMVILPERGIDCFQWQYRVRNFPGISFRLFESSSFTDKYTGLMLYYPPFENWQVREHKPLFIWYQTLSNIGGTLSIWTGASVLSFLHLLEVCCYKCYKRQWKVGDGSQIADSPP